MLRHCGGHVIIRNRNFTSRFSLVGKACYAFTYKWKKKLTKNNSNDTTKIDTRLRLPLLHSTSFLLTKRPNTSVVALSERLHLQSTESRLDSFNPNYRLWYQETKRLFFSSSSSSTSTTTSTTTTSSKSSSNNNDNIDEKSSSSVYDIYRRQPIVPYIWQELQLENLHTQRCINQDLMQTIYHELQLIVSNDNVLQQQEQQDGDDENDFFFPSADIGPTGTWRYQFIVLPETDTDVDRRVYIRFHPKSIATKEGIRNGTRPDNTEDKSATSRQVVLELTNPTEEIQAMSLSVDESCIACILLEGEENLQQQEDYIQHTAESKIIIRNIESGHTRTFKWGGSSSSSRNEEGKHVSEMKNISSLEWGPINPEDGRHLLYVVLADHQGRPNEVQVALIDVNALDEIKWTEDFHTIYQSDNPAVMVDVQRTKGCHYVAIQALTKRSNEIFLSSNMTELILVQPRKDNILYHLDVGEKKDVVMLISEDGCDYHLKETHVDSLPLHPSDMKINCKEDNSSSLSSSSSPSSVITDMDLFKDYLVLYERSTVDGSQHISVRNRNENTNDDKSKKTLMPLPEINNHHKHQNINNDNVQKFCGMVISPGGNMYYGSTTLRIVVESPTSMGEVCEYDFEKKSFSKQSSSRDALSSSSNIPNETKERKQQQQSISQENEYTYERIFVTSHDGVQIPMTLIYKADDDESEKHSTWWSSWFGSSSLPSSTSSSLGQIRTPRDVVLIGYGAYGEPINLSYDPIYIPLLQRGYVIAFAHTRGGGDLGKSWYHAGKEENKIKSIEDFESCGEFLKTRCSRWTKSLTARAFSAGGVLVGMTMNRRRDLFDTVVLTNAFLDVYATMTNPRLFLTVHEWDEYGNPFENLDASKNIHSICPVSNIMIKEESDPTVVPRTLVIGTLDDENVPYWNAVVFAKKLRDSVLDDDKEKILLHIESDGRHNLHGPTKRLEIAAMEISFILQSRKNVQKNTAMEDK